MAVKSFLEYKQKKRAPPPPEVIEVPVVGPKGDKGDRGEGGPQGPQGVAGRDGVDGRNGRDGVDGKDADLRTVTELINQTKLLKEQISVLQIELNEVKNKKSDYVFSIVRDRNGMAKTIEAKET